MVICCIILVDLKKKTKAYSVEETLCSTPYFPIKKRDHFPRGEEDLLWAWMRSYGLCELGTDN
jgi:hypothetical protein